MFTIYTFELVYMILLTVKNSIHDFANCKKVELVSNNDEKS